MAKLDAWMRHSVYRARMALQGCGEEEEPVAWMSVDIAFRLVERYNTNDALLEKTRINSRNRLQGKANHTQGRVSIVIVAERMEASLKKKATEFELFVETHKKTATPSVVDWLYEQLSLSINTWTEM